jgi:hypothetical protein
MIQLDCLYPFTKQECVMTDKTKPECGPKPEDRDDLEGAIVPPEASPNKLSGPTSPPPPPPGE